MTMRFTTPFVADSGFIGASNDRHYVNLAVTGFPLETVTISLPLDMALTPEARAIGQDGKEIPSTSKVSPRAGTINFSQAVRPDTQRMFEKGQVERENRLFRHCPSTRE
jgi:hypothetical protein